MELGGRHFADALPLTNQFVEFVINVAPTFLICSKFPETFYDSVFLVEILQLLAFQLFALVELHLFILVHGFVHHGVVFVVVACKVFGHTALRHKVGFLLLCEFGG